MSKIIASRRVTRPCDCIDETLLESPSYHSRVKLGLYLAENFVLTSLLA